MGNQPQNKQNQTYQKQMTEMSNQEEAIQEEQFIEVEECCFINYRKISRKRFRWQINFEENIKQMKQFYPSQTEWCDFLATLVKKSQYPRKRFYVEISTLKYQYSKPNHEENQILLSPSEVQSFKDNLKNSVLVTYSSIKPSHYSSSSSQISVMSGRFIFKNQQMDKNVIKVHHKNPYRSQRIDKPFFKNQLHRQQSKNRSLLRQSLLSFFQDTLCSILQSNQKQISKIASYSLQIFIRFSIIVQKHLKDTSCVLFNIQQKFINFLLQKYEQFLTIQLKQGDQQKIVNCVQTVNLFLGLMKQIIFDYYNLKIFIDEENTYNLITYDQNILSMMTAILFKDEKFYQLIFSMAIAYNQQRESQFESIIKQIPKCDPQFFQVKEQYCLHLNYQPKLGNSSMNYDEQMSDQFDLIPYSRCIQKLRQIVKSRSPISKMKVILACAQGITKEVQTFHINKGVDKKWIIDADQVLSIFCYIIAKAKIQHLHSHIFILEHFSTDHQLISVTGYYYSVLTCALQQIQKGLQLSIDRQLNDSK